MKTSLNEIKSLLQKGKKIVTKNGMTWCLENYRVKCYGQGLGIVKTYNMDQAIKKIYKNRKSMEIIRY